MNSISLAATYCNDKELIERLIEKNPQAFKETCGDPFAMTPYTHMKGNLDKKIAMMRKIRYAGCAKF